MLKLRATWNQRCDKRPKYDPKDGEAGIKGGCWDCWQLLGQYRMLKETIIGLGGVVEKRKGQ